MEQKSSDPSVKPSPLRTACVRALPRRAAAGRNFPAGRTIWPPSSPPSTASRSGCRQRPRGEEDGALLAQCIAELRAILEWTTYQSASIATAKALATARKTRAFAQRFGLLDDPAAGLGVLMDSEESLIENVRVKNDYMATLAQKYPHLDLPRPLVRLESLAPKVEKKAGKLDLIQQLTKSAKKKK